MSEKKPTIEERYECAKKILSDLWVLDGASSDDANYIEGFLTKWYEAQNSVKPGA